MLMSCPVRRHRTQAALSFMGCRVGYAAAVTAWVFDTLRKRFPLPICEDLPTDAANRSCISILSSRQLMSLISEGLALYEHSRLFRIKDFVIANDIFQQRRSFIIILGGNSGTGKSTLASILASRLGVTSVLSTDSIRHTLRSLVKKEDNPCLFVSTYEAGELYVSDDDVLEGSSVSSGQPSAKRLHKRKVIRGYMLQSLPVLDSLENILTSFERRNRSLIVEGVHLSMDVIVKIMKKHPGIIPFLIHISNEKKHMERFAIRSRNMTLSPKKNKYIKYFGNINCIQKLQRKMAQKHLIPMVDNTNVDRSVATIHSTIVQVLRRLSEGKTLLNSEDKCVILSREFERLHQTAWSSKSMRAILQQKVSKRILLKKLLLESPGPHGELATRIHHEDSSSSSDGSDHGYSDEEEEEGVEDEHKLREYSNNLDDHSESRFTAPAHGSPRFGGTEAAEIGSLFDGSRTQDLFSSEDEKGF